MKKQLMKLVSSLLILVLVMTMQLPATVMKVKAYSTNDWSAYAATGFAGGIGTEADPYLISTAEQLAYLAKQANTLNEAGNGVLNNFQGKYIKLTNDIDLSAHEWVPIGSAYYVDNMMGFSEKEYCHFKGKFNGDGKLIAGVKINKPQDDNVGFFGITYDATISNLGLINVEIVGKNCVGGLVGELGWTSDAINCYVTGTVSGFYKIGGFAGFLRNSEGFTQHCISTVNVTALTDYGVPTQIGGFAGAHEVNGITITKCVATGSVDGSTEGAYVGGFIGRGQAIRNCYATGNVTGKACIGGFFGTAYNNSVSSFCYAKGDVSGASGVGGFMGGRDQFSFSCNFSNCFAIGAVSGSAITGGFIGDIKQGAVNNCYYVNDIGTNGIGANESATVNVCEFKDTAFFTQEASYTTTLNWSFPQWDNTVWDFTNGYPSLKDMPQIRTVCNTSNQTQTSTQTSTETYNPDTTPTVKKEVIKVEVTDGESDHSVSQLNVERTTEVDGTKKDSVLYDVETAKETIEKLKQDQKDTARILVSDEQKEVSETTVKVEEETVDALDEGDINLEIHTEYARINIPKESLQTANQAMEEDLFFNLIPVRDEKEAQQAAHNAKEEAKKVAQFQVMSGDNSVDTVGYPVTIETNMPSANVDVILPINAASIPSSSSAREEFLSKLAVYIEHSDGTTELLRGKIVELKSGVWGIKFTIQKFSIFTILKADSLQMSEKCDVEAIALPSADILRHAVYVNVGNKIKKFKVNITVSKKATYQIYQDVECKKLITKKSLVLKEGRNRFYVKVSAENGFKNKKYLLVIDRKKSVNKKALKIQSK